MSFSRESERLALHPRAPLLLSLMAAPRHACSHLGRHRALACSGKGGLSGVREREGEEERGTPCVKGVDSLACVGRARCV